MMTDALSLPAGYSLKKEEIGGREYIKLFNDRGLLILAIPSEDCSQEKIKEVISQVQRN